MFIPDSRFKKLAKQYGACAYVYKDGVVIHEELTAKAGKYETSIKVVHAYPAEIKIVSRDWAEGKSWNGSDSMQARRLVVHNAKMLLSGLAAVKINYNTSSQASKEHGLTLTGVTFTLPNETEFSFHLTNWISQDVVVQPDYVGSYYNYGTSPESILEVIQYAKDHYEKLEIHGSLPVDASVPAQAVTA